MVLKHGYSWATISANIAELKRMGHTHNVALFLAYCDARRDWFKAHPRGHLIAELAYPPGARKRGDYTRDGRPLVTESELQRVANNPRLKISPRRRVAATVRRQKQFRTLPPRFENVTCSQCGGEFGPGNYGFSSCQDHMDLERIAKRNPHPSPPDVSRAAALYRGFTGAEPKTLRRLEIPPLPKTGLAIGKIFGILYSVDATGERFHHEFKGKARPTLIVSDDGKQVVMRGGAYTFTKRGFVDSK